MVYSSENIERLVKVLSSLPSIGRKSAQRLTYHLIKSDPTFIDNFVDALIGLKNNVHLCKICFNYTEDEICPICASEKRKRNIICVVEQPADVLAIEKTNEFNGTYHILHGVMNPLDGISANDIKIRELIQRISNIEEVILALNPSIEGEATSQYIAKLLRPFEIKITRIASGVPIGSSLEFTDELTLSKAIHSRIPF
jgi:recombination protein RecR